MTILVKEAKLVEVGGEGWIRMAQPSPFPLPPPNEFFRLHPEEEMGRGGPAHQPAALIIVHPFGPARWMALQQAGVQVRGY